VPKARLPALLCLFIKPIQNTFPISHLLPPRAGLVAIVPENVRHSVKALTDGKAIIVDYPARLDFA
jgi:hypothetical protein